MVGNPETIRSLALLATLHVRHLPQLCAEFLQFLVLDFAPTGGTFAG
jgi:hypothetical protein